MKNEEVLIYLLLCLLTLLLTVLLESILIPILKRLRAAQPILTVGPSWHLSKKGTPTMGGLAFIVALLFSFLLFCIYARRGGASHAPTAALVVIFATLSGAIGFFDDYQKLVKRENKGLSAWQKYMLQLLLIVKYEF